MKQNKQEIKTIEEAKYYIENVLNMELTDMSGFKWKIEDKADDINFSLKNDEELIEYANEQKEANEE